MTVSETGFHAERMDFCLDANYFLPLFGSAAENYLLNKRSWIEYNNENHAYKSWREWIWREKGFLHDLRKVLELKNNYESVFELIRGS